LDRYHPLQTARRLLNGIIFARRLIGFGNVEMERVTGTDVGKPVVTNVMAGSSGGPSLNVTNPARVELPPLPKPRTSPRLLFETKAEVVRGKAVEVRDANPKIID
jgi:hypothetical protein